ncbi:hypothetical protein H6G06_02245 [Anabaena sphaerica FACHB-251]|uniref:Uncharacterized protein n=1 Tax=Anabaena sphaerica FACHB-251 TaxID=2692883 RepID=A0A926WDW7_9NOST|nr:hypothetical protein [Anabaena sphaerica]MBD2292330.1 hypothetical protein [Anabaena sphaerica FACHB-251]
MLHTKIKELQEENSKLTTTNPILNAFSLDRCKEIDEAAENDKFIAQHRNEILDHLKKCSVGHTSEFKQAFDIYNEIITYLFLNNIGKNRSFSVIRVPEDNKGTPDFEVNFTHGETFYIEMKTLGFNDGDNNYVKATNKGLEAKVSLTEQINSGEPIAISEVVVSPFRKENKGYQYNHLNQTRIIDSIINKLNEDVIKTKQFAKGKTILLVNLSLMSMLPQIWQLNSVPIYQEKLYKSMISGILWYSAFGKFNERIFTTIEGEGSKNIEGELSTEGILNKYEFVKAVCFQIEDEQGNLKLVGFYRENDKDEIYHLIYPICDFVNNDYNTHGYEILQNIV